jgi:hypothetical protein
MCGGAECKPQGSAQEKRVAVRHWEAEVQQAIMEMGGLRTVLNRGRRGEVADEVHPAAPHGCT